MSENPVVQTSLMIASDARDQIFRATVQGVSGNEMTVIRDGSTTIEGPYATLEGNAAIAGDSVLVVRVSTSYVVLGVILHN